MNETKLHPCPFCGSRFIMGQEPNDNHPVSGEFYIFHEYGPIGSKARECRLDVRGHFESKEAALDFWNNRQIPPNVLGLLNEASDFIQPFNRGEDLLSRIETAVSSLRASA